MAESRIGIIGGSGLYEMEGFEVTDRVTIETPFGSPSDEYVIGNLEGKPVVFLPRHGRGHLISAHEVNFQANIYGMKKLGVKWILSVSAVGSLKEVYHPGDLVMVDQFIDITKHRKSTFFGNGITGHILLADPICKDIQKLLFDSAKSLNITAHSGGTYVCMEGPQLSTRAESHRHQGWGGDVIGMTNVTEAKLAREAEICYGTMAMITDYDCWHETDEAFSAEKIVATFKENVKKAKAVLKQAVIKMNIDEDACSCHNALDGAVLTDLSLVSDEVKERLDVIAGRLWKEQ